MENTTTMTNTATYCLVFFPDEGITALERTQQLTCSISINNFEERRLCAYHSIIALCGVEVIEKKRKVLCPYCRVALPIDDPTNILLKNIEHATVPYLDTFDAETISLFTTIAVLTCGQRQKCAKRATEWITTRLTLLRTVMENGGKDIHYARQCANPTCGKLSNQKMLQCGRCVSTYYCSSDCQRAHWTEHKKACKIFSEKKTK